jgi:hypothetical protein
MRQRVHRTADTGRPYGSVSDLAEVLTVVRRKGVTTETAMRKCMGRKPRTAMMATTEMREAMTTAEMTTAEMTAAEMTASEMRAAKVSPTEVAAATEMSPAATEMGATTTEMGATTTAVTTTSAASAERRARQRGHKNQNGNRDA